MCVQVSHFCDACASVTFWRCVCKCLTFVKRVQTSVTRLCRRWWLPPALIPAACARAAGLGCWVLGFGFEGMGCGVWGLGFGFCVLCFEVRVVFWCLSLCARHFTSRNFRAILLRAVFCCKGQPLAPPPPLLLQGSGEGTTFDRVFVRRQQQQQQQQHQQQ